MQDEMSAVLVAVDWGTSSFRARTVRADRSVIDTISTDEGILKAKGRFEEVFRTHIPALKGYRAGLPVILSGMIGSRNGWVEVPYATMPTKPDALSKAMTKIEVEGIGDVWFIPGIMAEGDKADVMRGEETEIFGALEMLGIANATMIIPGTHSKHVDIRDGAIQSYRTYITGEMFHALTTATILGAFGKDVCEDCEWFAEGVRIGARDGNSGALLNRLFTARARVLVDGLPENHAACYLSGMLIGAELKEAMGQDGDIWILGNGRLPEIYLKALKVLGGDAKIVPMGGVVHGAMQVAEAIELV